MIIGNSYKGTGDTIPNTFVTGAGEALILFGGAKMDSIPDIILHGENEGDQFGSTAASTGDVNGDGFPDFLVTAIGYPEAKGKRRSYVYFGGSVLDTIPDIKLTGENDYDGFGMFIAHGDVNNDHCDDLLSSAPNANNANGKVYLYLGGSTINTPYWTAQKDSANALMGVRVAIGDINGDKWKDLIVNSRPLIDRRGNFHTLTEIYMNHNGIDSTAFFSIWCSWRISA